MENNFNEIDWKTAREMVNEGLLECNSANYAGINNQASLSISSDKKRLYKRRLSSVKTQYDLIAKSK